MVVAQDVLYATSILHKGAERTTAAECIRYVFNISPRRAVLVILNLMVVTAVRYYPKAEDGQKQKSKRYDKLFHCLDLLTYIESLSLVCDVSHLRRMHVVINATSVEKFDIVEV